MTRLILAFILCALLGLALNRLLALTRFAAKLGQAWLVVKFLEAMVFW